MADKEFTVRSTKSGETHTLKGNTARDAIIEARLNPDIWKEVQPEPEPEPPEDG